MQYPTTRLSLLAATTTFLFATNAFADAPKATTETAKESPKKEDSKPAGTPKEDVSESGAAGADASKGDAKDPRKKPAVAQGRDANSSAGDEDGKGAHAKGKPPVGDPYDIDERDNYTYRFVGARYRANFVPKFLVNAFVSEGASLTSHNIGIEYEIRRDGMSIIPSLAYQEYGTSKDVLFVENSKPKNIDGNWSLINSSLKSINAQVDILWSARVDRGVDFEYGLGVGMGVVFDKLMINWVYSDPAGKYKTSDGRSFSTCQIENQRGGDGQLISGCTKAGHSNADVAKVGGYNEPSWFNGGFKPVILPFLSPEFGFRFKPSKEFSSRFTVGWSLTGPWLGLSGSYGFAPTKHKAKTSESDLYEQ